MSQIPHIDYETASEEIRAAHDEEVRVRGNMTNMKRTLLHSPEAHRIYAEWFTLRAELNLLPSRFVAGWGRIQWSRSLRSTSAPEMDQRSDGRTALFRVIDSQKRGRAASVARAVAVTASIASLDHIARAVLSGSLMYFVNDTGLRSVLA